jgi:hypothetical protein
VNLSPLSPSIATPSIAATPPTIQPKRTQSRRRSRCSPSTQRQATAQPRRLRRDPVGIVAAVSLSAAVGIF